MTRQSKIFVFVFAALVSSGLATAGGSLEETRWRDSHDKTLQSGVDNANKACGTSIAGKFDWSTLKFDDWQTLFGSIGGPTRDYLIPGHVLQEVCIKPDGKAAVAKEIKTIVIKAGDAPSVSLKDGELDYVVSLKDKAHYVPRREVLSYVEKHL